MSAGIQARFRIDRGAFCLDVDLALPDRGVSVLFGHSGSGKTTILRAMAGLERAPGGHFAIGETVWQDADRFTPVHEREIGVVFQEATLFPHLNVRRNLEFGLRRVPAGTRCHRLKDVAEMLGIAHLLDRPPGQLSGGERQRAAIARALLNTPRILLMDEPLAALDLKRKREILPYLERMHRELSIPVIYVSHSPEEVARLADHLVLLDEGRAIASGTLNTVLSRIDLPAAFAGDAGVVLDTVIDGQEEDHITRLRFPGGVIRVAQRAEPVGTPLRCRVHARNVSLALVPQPQTSILNCVSALVVDLAPTDTPGQMLVRLDCAGEPLLARITERSVRKLEIRPGLAVRAQIKSVALLD
ncbi:molybdenum ABC transporter ATP-binding protein [Nitrogeniibacter mangrovi]|uniref:Molybdenum ABC transporter ATP-binding protein n=1 Tax=Nitrogeniibacter mangrovi TaxID=2016596 RepID=A0A6C1B717_9RHOO|nr:molybdenum ABC transporter ATP-binding protein [Nitrogeniibacter mangrovi]QID19501.1 molybdenum ABC transporter ATP-binding protein [Nitrogeniibacter mangrovi]